MTEPAQKDRPRFHLAFPVHDIAAARRFYGDVLGCAQGRGSDHWVDFEFHGHQIVAHLAPQESIAAKTHSEVDDHKVPVPHFGLILEWADWESLASRLKAANVDFLIKPYLRFRDKAGEQATLFVRDPSGNALEFKAFRDEARIFANE